jgi:type IV pilus assembly protein PilY1
MRPTPRISLLAALALLAPAAAAQDDAACSVAASSYADAILNPPRGEDVDFFVTSGGIPNIMFLLSTSQSMLRMPPNGAAGSWGSFVDTTKGSIGQAYGYGCVNDIAAGIRFASACGTLAKEGQPYSASSNWAEETEPDGTTYCPSFEQAGQPMTTNRKGYDPDFYHGKPDTQALFPAGRVYHDALARTDIGNRSGASAWLADGWASGTANSVDDTQAAFCARFTDAGVQAECATCMTSKGYFFDGTYLPDGTALGPPCGLTNECQQRGWGTCVKDSNGSEHNSGRDNTAHCRLPNVWFKGNFLNFYPPKFVVARKVVKDILGGVKLFRLAVATTRDGDGANVQDNFKPACNQVDSRSNFYSNRAATKNAINGYTFAGDAALAEALLDVGHHYAYGGGPAGQPNKLPWFAYPGSPYARSSNPIDLTERQGNQASICFPCQKSSVIFVTDGITVKDSNIPGVAGWAPADATLAAAECTSTGGACAGKSGYNITTIDCPECATPAEAPDTSGDIAANQCKGQQLTGACDDSNNPSTNYLPRVAWYLHNMDFRPSNERQAGGAMTEKQSIDIYPIGFAVQGSSATVLAHTATNGGGLYNGGIGAESVGTASQLKQAIAAAIDEVSSRSISFASASLSTLQASASQSVLVPRFIPEQKAHWNGHLYSFDLWSEFTGGCSVPTSGPSDYTNADYDCDSKCTSVFLRDRDGVFIGEDATGAFKRVGSPASETRLAPCGNGSRCTKAAGTCDDIGTVDAEPFWDVGEMLSRGSDEDGAKEWNERRIYTVIDDASPRKEFTGADTVVQLADDDATITTLLPYLNVKGNTTFCQNLARQLRARGNYTKERREPAGCSGASCTITYSAPGAANQIEEGLGATTATGTPAPDFRPCAKAVVQYVMGADIFGETGGCADGWEGTVPPRQGRTYCSRANMLGDIFHSSPVEVWPPLGSDGLLCSRGLHPQCLPSLFSESIPSTLMADSTNANAYDDYAKSTYYKHRDKFALVGGNDGMLHAIVTGVWHAGANDPRTIPNEALPPYEGYHDIGTGEEVWGFIPPDLLAKLPLYLGTKHQYFVDGTPMVRDVWIDGSSNKLGTSSTRDGRRDGNEFHTVAVVGERRGGTHYFALDVTDAGPDLDAAPKFLWLYPQPNDPEQLEFGSTYAEFVPTPPPIGPVRVDTGDAQPCPATSRAYGTTCFEERWIVFLSGGYDPQMTKGRGVHMVQIADGKELWDFSQPTGAASSCDAATDPRCALHYPVAAPVGMMMWGSRENYLSTADAAKEGYFDTATFGDTGGQLWVLRFREPGHIGTNGKVDNWWGARIFQMNRSTAATRSGIDFCEDTQPFFHITANLPLSANGAYRVLAGTGDRFNLLDPAGGVCSPDNLRACVAKGCTVTLQSSTGGAGAVYGVSDLLGSRSYKMVHNAECSGFSAADYTHESTAGSPSGSCNAVTAKIDRLSISCPAALTCSTMEETTGKELSVVCSGGSCRPGVLADEGSSITLEPLADGKNWYFSIRVWDPDGDRIIFTDQTSAARYDAARLTETDLVDINAYDASPTTAPLASATDTGWKYFFDHGEGGSNTVTTTEIDGEAYHMYRADERVASSSAVEAACTFWNTIQVVIPESSIATSTNADGTTECPANTPCKAGKKQLTYLYGAHPGTGGMCLYVGGALSRVQQSQAIVPPHIGKLVAYVSSGQVSFGLTSVRIPQGGTNISLGEAQDVTSLVEWIPIDRGLEKCRHAPKTSAPAASDCK